MSSIIQTRKFSKFEPVRCTECSSCLTTDVVNDFIFDDDSATLTFTVTCVICGKVNSFVEPVVIAEGISNV